MFPQVFTCIFGSALIGSSRFLFYRITTKQIVDFYVKWKVNITIRKCFFLTHIIRKLARFKFLLSPVKLFNGIVLQFSILLRPLCIFIGQHFECPSFFFKNSFMNSKSRIFLFCNSKLTLLIVDANKIGEYFLEIHFL